MQVLTSDEVTKEVSLRKQPLDRGLLLVLRESEERTEGLSKLSKTDILFSKHSAAAKRSVELFEKVLH